MVGLDYNRDVQKIQVAIKQQPIIIAITANNKYIHSYASGIIDAADCYAAILYDDENINALNHGVLAVGYGHDKTTGLEYMLVKNSWNTTWGDSGYFKLALTDGSSDFGICGIKHPYPLYPVLN